MFQSLRAVAFKSFVPSLLGVGCISMSFVRAQQTFQIDEVPLTNAFIAPEGFDSNDDVLVVVEGYFPNGCYFKGNTDVHKDMDTHKIVIRQFAKIENEGACADHTQLDAELAKPKYFMAELYLGTMSPYSSYQVQYLGSDNQTQVKTFSVDKAPVDHVDSMRYAIIENAFVSHEVQASDKKMEIRITGYLNSSCSEIIDDPENKDIIFYDDVIVVLLKVVNKGEFCIPMNKSFYKVREVKVPAVGRYLLHTRSQGGQAKNKIFSVIESKK
jgi:hypothetical protein